MIKSINQVYALIRPGTAEQHAPIVVDSPHSGTIYPFNTGIVAPSQALKTTWDAFVDELWEGVFSQTKLSQAVFCRRHSIDRNAYFHGGSKNERPGKNDSGGRRLAAGGCCWRSWIWHDAG
jgi:N-formylglutamate amidohydrolase